MPSHKQKIMEMKGKILFFHKILCLKFYYRKAIGNLFQIFFKDIAKKVFPSIIHRHSSQSQIIYHQRGETHQTVGL